MKELLFQKNQRQNSTIKRIIILIQLTEGLIPLLHQFAELFRQWALVFRQIIQHFLYISEIYGLHFHLCSGVFL